MANRLLVAAGGGGDELAAIVIEQATRKPGDRAYFAGYSWERLIVDPVPGPRTPPEFTGLESLGQLNYRVTPDTKAILPARSLMPRLAQELDVDMFLLDPRHGTQGLGRQLAELTELLGLDVVQLVDVGGDILARGDEPGLRSPLADALTLGAAAMLDIPVDVLVAGPGLDGELDEDDVVSQLTKCGERLHILSSADVAPFIPVLDWYPSDVTGLLLRAAQGHRGVAELRDGGLRVQLTSQTLDVWRVLIQVALDANDLARTLQRSTSLEEAEVLLRTQGRDSEIDYERQKQIARAQIAGSAQTVDDLLSWLRRREIELAREGVTFLSVRRAADALNLTPTQFADYKQELLQSNRERLLPPVWLVRAR